MTQQPAIAILGASGRMGQMLAQTVLASDKAKLVAAADRVGSDWIGPKHQKGSKGTCPRKTEHGRITKNAYFRALLKPERVHGQSHENEIK